MLITSRSVASYFDLALSTENGLIFGTLINQYREIKFNVNSEKIAQILSDREIQAIAEFDKDKFVITINGMSQIIIYDRNQQSVFGIKNSVPDSTYYGILVQTTTDDSNNIWFKNTEFISILDV